jgi:hypothetical protein
MELNSENMNETEVERETTIDSEQDRVIIESELKQTADIMTFMDMFEQKVNEHREVSRSLRDMEQQIEEALDNGGEQMEALHRLDPQHDDRGEVKANSVDPDTMRAYASIQQGYEQMKQKREQLENIEEDLEELHPAAEAVVEEYEEVEMPQNWEEFVRDEVL